MFTVEVEFFGSYEGGVFVKNTAGYVAVETFNSFEAAAYAARGYFGVGYARIVNNETGYIGSVPKF